MKTASTTNRIITPPTGLVVPSRNLYTTQGDEAGIVDHTGKPFTPPRLFRTPPLNYDLTRARLFNLSPGIDPDLDRYNDILRGKARERLKKFISPGEMIGKKGDNIVSIPVPTIRIPHFRQGSRGSGGVGQGDGNVGQPIAGGPPQPGGDPDKAGGDPADHIREELIPMSRSEIAQFIIEDLGLPNLLPKGQHQIKKEGIKWTTKSRVGNDLLLQESIMNAIRRAVVEMGDKYDLEDPEQLNAFLDAVLIEDKDMVYQSWTVSEKPETSAVILYMMDVSGSMTDEQKEMVRREAWYLSTIIQYSYGQIRAQLRNETYSHGDFGQGIEEVFIIHDAMAKEVSEEEFYTTRESGGTRISSAYKVAQSIIKQRYNPAIWNIYMFHFTDGDNWGEDNNAATTIIKELVPQINEFGYVQVKSPYGSGDFMDVVKSIEDPKVRTAAIESNDDDEFRKATIALLKEKGGK